MKINEIKNNLKKNSLKNLSVSKKVVPLHSEN